MIWNQEKVVELSSTEVLLTEPGSERNQSQGTIYAGSPQIGSPHHGGDSTLTANELPLPARVDRKVRSAEQADFDVDKDPQKGENRSSAYGFTSHLLAMSLPDFSNADTLSKFESFLTSKSYIDGYVTGEVRAVACDERHMCTVG